VTWTVAKTPTSRQCSISAGETRAERLPLWTATPQGGPEMHGRPEPGILQPISRVEKWRGRGRGRGGVDGSRHGKDRQQHQQGDDIFHYFHLPCDAEPPTIGQFRGTCSLQIDGPAAWNPTNSSSGRA
jgi:hypothetical protein